jgi:hypothetical protein
MPDSRSVIAAIACFQREIEFSNFNANHIEIFWNLVDDGIAMFEEVFLLTDGQSTSCQAWFVRISLSFI